MRALQAVDERGGCYRVERADQGVTDDIGPLLARIFGALARVDAGATNCACIQQSNEGERTGYRSIDADAPAEDHACKLQLCYVSL